MAAGLAEPAHDLYELIGMRRLFILTAFLGAQAQAGEAWLYQLQNPAPARIEQSGFTKVIMDYSHDGTADEAFTAAEIAPLAAKGRTALCYFSIGEAEEYRFYWKKEWKGAKRPAWLGRENPDWEGNYCVRYWQPEWRERVLQPYLEKIVAQGFSGVYLDIVDGFEYWGDPDSYGPNGETLGPDDPADETEAARRMVDLLAWIKQTGTELRKGPFLVFAQNGERLLSFPGAKKFRAAVDGLGVESLWFHRKKALPEKDTAARLALLREGKKAGLQVVITDYIDDGSGPSGQNGARIREFIARCNREGFDHYAARQNQELDAINRIEGLQP